MAWLLLEALGCGEGCRQVSPHESYRMQEQNRMCASHKEPDPREKVARTAGGPEYFLFPSYTLIKQATPLSPEKSMRGDRATMSAILGSSLYMEINAWTYEEVSPPPNRSHFSLWTLMQILTEQSYVLWPRRCRKQQLGKKSKFMTAFPLSCNYIFKKLQKKKIQENSETAMSWAGQRNFFMGEEIGGGWLSRWGRWECFHLEADRSNTGGSLASPGLWVKVKGAIPTIPFLMSKSWWALGKWIQGRVMCYALIVRMGGGILSQRLFVEDWDTLQSVLSDICWGCANLKKRCRGSHFSFLRGTS